MNPLNFLSGIASTLEDYAKEWWWVACIGVGVIFIVVILMIIGII